MKREPSLYIGAIGAILSLVATFGLSGLSGEQAALWLAVLNLALGAWNALKVRPVAPAAFTYLISGLASLGAAYGLDLSAETVSAVNFSVISVLALLLRGNVEPTSKAPATESVRARTGPSPY